MKTLNRLKVTTALVAMSLWASAGAAQAQQVEFNVPRDLSVPKATLTRAEVIADFLVWRASGLHALHNRGSGQVDTTSHEYEQATARYMYMRESPQFADLVDQTRLHGARLALTSIR